ncbi:MAG: hypothetical protein U0871_13575 [Gemmataceae bacterium]
MKLDQLKAPDTIAGRLVKEAAALGQEFRDPVAVAKQKLSDLDQMVAGGLIHGDVRNLAAADFMRDLAAKAGQAGQLPLPVAAEVSSHAFAQLQSRAFAGEGPASVEEVLRAIRQGLDAEGRIGEETLRQLRKIADALTAPGESRPGGG